MRKAVLSAVCWVLLTGCSVDHTIADDPQGSSERLRARFADFCATECERISGCPAEDDDCACSADDCDCAPRPTPSESECRARCLSMFDEASRGGESCSATGLELMDCISSTSCVALRSSDSCEHLSELLRPCLDEDSSSGEPPVATPPGPGGSSVRCSSGFGTAGTSGGTGVPNPQTTCDMGWDDCSDGHGYRLICLAGANDSASCTCFLDGVPSTTFTPASSSCPSGTEMNAACGWRLEAF